MKNQTMSLEDLKNRLQDRIKHLEERLTIRSVSDSDRTMLNVKTELNTAHRRLRLLNEKVLLGRTGGGE